MALAALCPRSQRPGSAGRAPRTTPAPSGSCPPGDAPWPPPPRPGRRSGRGAGRRRRRRGDCLLPAPRVSSPRHREGQGDWARGPRPVSASAPGLPLARALSPRVGAALASHGAGRSHESGRGLQLPRATGQRCPQCARCPGAPSTSRPARDAAAASAPSQPAPDHPKVRGSGGGGGSPGGHAPGAPVCGFISSGPAKLRSAALRLKFSCLLSRRRWCHSGCL